MNQILWNSATDMEWRQESAFKSDFVLSSGGEPMGSLHVHGWWHSKVWGETALGKVEFRHEGFWHQKYVIVDTERKADIAAYVPDTWRAAGTLSFVNGRQFRWKVKSFWKGTYIFTDQRQAVVLEMKTGLGTKWPGTRDWFKANARVHIAPQECPPETMSVLVLAGWYLMLRSRDAQSSAAAAV